MCDPTRLARPGSGHWGTAANTEQSLTPRKGGIFKREYLQPYLADFEFVVVSVDSEGGERPDRLHDLGCVDRPDRRLPEGHADHGMAQAPADPREEQEPQERGESDAGFADHKRPLLLGHKAPGP
jgi:hypothetical protein